MSALIEMLVDSLKQRGMDCAVLKVNEAAEIREIRLLPDEPAPELSPHTLYICGDFELLGLDNCKDGSFLCIPSDAAQEAVELLECSILICCCTAMGPKGLLGVVQPLFDGWKEEKDNQIKAALLHALTQRDSMESITALASEWMGNPIAIMDMAHKAICKTEVADPPPGLEELLLPAYTRKEYIAPLLATRLPCCKKSCSARSR